MEDSLSSIFNYHESIELRQKLLEATLELESLRNIKTELLNLLKIAHQERDEAREQLQKLVKKLIPPISFVDAPPESLVMLPTTTTTTTKANSSITESNSPSHVSSPVDSLIEAVSSPEFSNINVVDNSNNLCYLNQSLVQDLSGSSPSYDLGTAVIDYLSKGKVLPQKGNLLQAVMDAGPLLQTLVVAGPLPNWRNPPPLQAIKIPPLMVNKDFGGSNANAWNSFQKPALPSPHSLHLNNVGGVNNNITSASRNSSLQFTSNASCNAPPVFRQSHQHLL